MTEIRDLGDSDLLGDESLDTGGHGDLGCLHRGLGLAEYLTGFLDADGGFVDALFACQPVGVQARSRSRAGQPLLASALSPPQCRSGAVGSHRASFSST